jgi:hypothetical protein
VERNSLLEELDELTGLDKNDMSKKETEKNASRLIEISERLDLISANEAETKAIQILIGIGFS